MVPQFSRFFFSKSFSFLPPPLPATNILNECQPNFLLGKQGHLPPEHDTVLARSACVVYKRISFSTNDKLTFKPGSLSSAALLKVPIIPADTLGDSSLITLKIMVSVDKDIGKNKDSDPRFGVSDGVSFIGFESVDKKTPSSYSPCFGVEGTSGNSLTGRKYINRNSPTPNIYTGQFVITLKLNEGWGSCSQAHNGGFVKTAAYKKRLLLSKGLTLEAYKDDNWEQVGIKFIEVTMIDNS